MNKPSIQLFNLLILVYHAALGFVLCCVVVEKSSTATNYFLRSGDQTLLLGGLRGCDRLPINSYRIRR